MKKKHSEYIENDDYEWYEERGKDKIKRVRTDVRPKRETRNWKKAWSEHTDDYDERDEFYGRQ
jgi:hypothetical protein